MSSKHNNSQDRARLGGCSFCAIIALAVIAIVVGLCSSCSPRIIEKIVTQYRDTTIYKESVRDTTVYVPLPLGKDQAIVNVNDTSHLETQLAVSDAYFGSDGFLHHSLENKQGTLPVVVPVKSMFIYTNVSSNKSELHTEIEYRDKPLSWLQSFKIGIFWYLFVALLACLIYIFRKPILNAIKLWLKF